MIALILSALFVVSQCHMCLLSPYQRGAVASKDLNSKGSDACGLTTGPCGNVNASDAEMTAFASGETIAVVMQKNLDHYASATPGNFTVMLRHPNTTRFVLGSVADTSDPTFSIYQVVGTIPKTDEGPYVLEAVYNTNNADAPPAFYQCADIRVHDPSMRRHRQKIMS